MAYDGSLIFDTKIDNAGFKKGVAGIKGVAGKSAKAVTSVMKGAVVAVGAVGIASIKVGADFEAGMSQVASTMGITVEEINNGSKSFDMLEKAAKEMGATTMYSATESAEALNYLALAGYNAEDSVEMLPKVLNLASAGGLDLAYASDMVTDSMSALSLNISEADGFIDQMAKTSQKSNTNVEQLGEAILTVGANAKDLKGGTVELNTALGLLANVGIKGAEAGTKLRNVIRSISTPTDKAKTAFKELGVDTYDASGELRGMDEIMMDLNKSMDGMTTQEKKEMISQIFNPADMGAALTLLASTSGSVDDLGMALEELGVPVDKIDIGMGELVGKMGEFESSSDFAKFAMEEFGFTAEESEIAYGILTSALEDGTAWEELEAQIIDSDNAAEEMSKTLNDNLKGDIEILKSALAGLGIEIYQSFDTPLRDVVQTLTGYIDKIAETMTTNKELVEQMLEMGESTDELGRTIEEIPTGFLGMAEVIGEVFADIIVKLAEFAPRMMEMGVQLMTSLIGGIRENLPAIMEAATEAISSFSEGWLSLAPEILVLGIEVITGLIQGIAQSIPQLIPIAMESIQTIMDSLIENLPLIMEAGVQILVALIEGIADNMTELIGMSLDLIVVFADAIIDNLPILIKAGLQLIVAIAKGVMDNLPKLIKEAPRIINEFADGIYKMLPTILATGIKIIGELIKGLIKSIPTLVANIPAIIMAVVNVFTLYNWASIGKNAITKLGSGIKSMISNIGGIAKNLASNVINAIKGIFTQAPSVGSGFIRGIISGISSLISSVVSLGRGMATSAISAIKTAFLKAPSLGRDMVKGIWNGISNVSGWIMSKIKGFGSSIVKGIKGIFKIKSPSRIMRDEVGKNLALGIGEGLEREIPSLQRNIDKDMGKLTAQMKNTVDLENSNLESGITTTGKANSFKTILPSEKEQLKEGRGTIITGNEFFIREEADINKVARELETLRIKRARR